MTYHPSQYVLLVIHAGWTHLQYESWMCTTVLNLLADPVR